MNISKYCANCHLHDWKQLDDKTQLQRCKDCKVIEYCGTDCQREHWNKVHREQCQRFIDSANNHDGGHKEINCFICREAASVGVAKLKKPRNRNYGCIYKEYVIPPNTYHPHPFLMTGQPGDTREKAILVLWHLLYKCVITRHWVARNCKEGLTKLFAGLMEERISIWEARKVYPSPENVFEKASIENVNDNKIDVFYELQMLEVKSAAAFIVDPLQLLKIISKIVNKLLFKGLCDCKMLKALKAPQSSSPDELKELVSRGLANEVRFLAMADQILDALATKVIPYQELIKIICGGSVRQNCSFCSLEIVIASVTDKGSLTSPTAFFDVFNFGMYSCGRGDCIGKTDKSLEDAKRFCVTMGTLVAERLGNRCDFCLQLPPKKGTSFCTGCFTTMYCSETCQKEDWQFHKAFCGKDMDERKIKFSCGGRKKKAKEGIRDVQEIINDIGKVVGDASTKEVFEVVDKFKLKNIKKSEK